MEIDLQIRLVSVVNKPGVDRLDNVARHRKRFTAEGKQEAEL